MAPEELARLYDSIFEKFDCDESMFLHLEEFHFGSPATTARTVAGIVIEQDGGRFWNRSSALLRDSYDFKCLNFDDTGNGNCCTLPVCENVYADCCDGSDEYDGKVKCSNTCWEAGKVARDKLKKKIATYQEGVTLRKHEIEQAKLALAKDEAELSKLKNEEKILKGLVQQFKASVVIAII
ncbi:hypothetical protein RHGRI_021837 [Rhododendron griersonianum]|uniref:EF-hand domain-containing protein n=1 Tax=Rhododendron griersonianum TaxID=479676 RepID=A0AAV6JPY0_9ERIC|nr:hypothetical protein RHGRI_021837 [Rhododendron griersonianum]